MKKKILMVATVTGHINAFHIPYLKYFKENGYEVHVATGDTIEVKNYCDKKIIIPIKRSPYSFSNLKAIYELKKIIDAEEYDIIHCHTPMGGIVARIAAKKARKNGTRVIYTAHGFHFYKGAPLKNWLIYYPIEKLMSRYTDCLITISLEDYELAKRKFSKIKKIEHIYGIGMNEDRLQKNLSKKDKKEIRSKLNINENDIVISYVAELNKNKNQIMLINIVEKLKFEYPDIKLLLIGNGKFKEYYQEIITKKNLENNVFLLGKRNDICELLGITDIYTPSSIREGLGVNVIEAMYMELPIVASNNRGHRELVENNVNGIIVKNESEMQVAIKKLIDDSKLRCYMADNSKIKTEKYLLSNVIKNMIRIYETFIN